jgi:hypothetical protein
VQCAALGVGEVVAFVVGDEFDHGTRRQRGRFIENEPSVLDPGSKRAHAITVRLPLKVSKGVTVGAHFNTFASLEVNGQMAKVKARCL